RLAFLLYYHPIEVREHGIIQFDINVQEVSTDPESAERLVKDAVAALSGPAPAGSPSCGFCKWNSVVGEWQNSRRTNL
ncbi:MAG: hypothetical protein ACREJ6_15515, partial [Candidatus Methylomirabilis sp.]